MKSTAVIDIGFGDSGKGRVVDWLCSKDAPSLVVRFSGGQQAGHHVVHKDIDHVFANFGSGSLYGIPTYTSKYCTVDPVGILNELKVLEDKGICPTLYIDAKCPVTTMYDKKINIKNDSENHHGSCGVGVGQTWEREQNHYHLLFEDLFHPTVLKIKMELIKKYYSFHNSYTTWLKEIEFLINKKNIHLVYGIPEDNTYLFEGSQGLLLDQNIGFFPHVTRSDTGTKNIIKMNQAPDLYLVTRAYQTRHGNGPMTNRSYYHSIKWNPYEQNFDEGFQGVFRCSLLDLDLLKYSTEKDEYIRDNPNKNLVITCLDLIEEYKLTINGNIIDCKTENGFVKTIKEYLGIKNIFLSRSPKGDIKNFYGR